MKKFLTLLVVLVLMAGCNDDDDCNMACSSGPPGYSFELVDSELQENLFSEGMLDPSEISLTNASGEHVEFSFITENNLNLISIGFWDTENTEYQLQIGEELLINLIVDVEQRTENCCTFYEVLEFDIPDYEYEQSQSTEIITIFIETQQDVSE